jgi:hypothetical protein
MIAAWRSRLVVVPSTINLNFQQVAGISFNLLVGILQMKLVLKPEIYVECLPILREDIFSEYPQSRPRGGTTGTQYRGSLAVWRGQATVRSCFGE